MLILAGIVVIVCAGLGVLLTLLTLPGTWFALAAAVGCKFWQPGLMPWWVIGVGMGLAALAEVVEIGASSLGSSKAGGSRRGGIGALVGGVVGALAGSPFFFPIGTVLGAVLGAGVGALLAERLWARRSWAEATKSGQGAAVGRFAAVVMKSGSFTAEELMETLSAPALSRLRKSSILRTPPPTVRGMNTCSAVACTISRMMLRASWLAVMSRKTSSSAPWVS